MFDFDKEAQICVLNVSLCKLVQHIIREMKDQCRPKPSVSKHI